jgi:hypothetical protein
MGENPNISGVITDHSLTPRALGRYIGMTEEEWLKRYGEITVDALVGENRVRFPFKLQLEHIELVMDPDAVFHDTFVYRARFRSYPGADWLMERHVEGRLIMKRDGLAEYGTFRTV